MFARTCAGDTPGSRRAMVRNIIATLFRRYDCSNQVMGTQTSIDCPVSTPANPAGATPTTV